ncbi:GTPase [Pseudomonas paraveronii]|uniref:GTPase n=1 Tax=Pseudomonas paraveronii TaxID=3040598 RepID=UPI002AAFA7ED|nr:GTPase [Pseudomonas sp. FLM 11]
MQEKAFIDALKGFEYLTQRVEADESELRDWQAALTRALSVQPSLGKLNRDGHLARQAQGVREVVQVCINDWGKSWARNQPSAQLAETFGDKAVILVFGKVNAGKSSFCNFIAERFAAQGEAVQYFHLANDSIVDRDEPFAEGETETTSQIQGIRLGQKLILIDTPGLLSVTGVNGELTKRYTDSADAVLWLSSSTAPGQVQELAELEGELKRNKPLLPIITKSDFFDEDEVPGQDELVKVLRNKTAANRKMQEEDVHKRAAEQLTNSHLDAALLKPVVSVSVRFARAHASQADALDSAGFERLFQQLQLTAQEARTYKEGKATQLMISHLENNVLHSLRSTVLPQLDELRNATRTAVHGLKVRNDQIASAVLADVLLKLGDLLETHKATQDVKALTLDVNALCQATIEHHLTRELKDYVNELKGALVDMSSDDIGSFEDLGVDIERVTGRGKQAAAAASASAIGTAIGTAFGGPLGALAGGLLGGMIGGAVGKYMVETEMVRQVVGVSYARLHAKLESDLRARLPKAVNVAVDTCIESINLVEVEAMRLFDIIATSEQDLKQLKERIAR